MSVKQEELDLLESEILKDIFGGDTPDRFVVQYGIFKYDMSPKIQSYIDKLESFLKPLMDENGLMDVEEAKKYLKLPEQFSAQRKFRPVDFYRNNLRPILRSIIA
jgi:hypothetical protein